jgi:hypothetical protein
MPSLENPLKKKARAGKGKRICRLYGDESLKVRSFERNKIFRRQRVA